jgi:putative protease
MCMDEDRVQPINRSPEIPRVALACTRVHAKIYESSSDSAHNAIVLYSTIQYYRVMKYFSIRTHVASALSVQCGASAPRNTAKKTVLRKNPALYKEDRKDATTRSDMLLSGGPLLKPEILAPAGGYEQLYAAAENGADAVYFGVSNFNARARAENFSVDDLVQVMSYLHERNMKGYLVLNVLIFDDELVALAEIAQKARSAGVDAVIVQDLGAVELIKAAAPGLAIHGSTQMTVTSVEGMEFSRTRGLERVVVGRELSVEDIAEISRNTDVEIEAFVHGALCVSYSGQCFSSEAWGGRSANRGQCAQACRLPYGLLVDGELKDFAERYVLSPQDLAAIDLIPEMIQAGVASLKIEGRLKGPEYVAMTTQAYRNAVDAAWTGLQNGKRVGSDEMCDSKSWEELKCVFSRAQDDAHDGLTEGFLGGTKHQTLVRGRNPRHRGVYVGRVISIERNRIIVDVEGAGVKLGDGLVVDQGRPEDVEVGGSIFELRDSKRRKKEACKGEVVEIWLGPGDVDVSRVRKGDLIFKNKDPALMRRLRNSYEAVSSSSRRRAPLRVSLKSHIGKPLEIKVTEIGGEGREVTTSTASCVQVASKKPTSIEDIRKAVGVHLGDEGSFYLECFEFDGDLDDVSGIHSGFIPLKEVKDARRKAIQALLQQPSPTTVALEDPSKLVNALQSTFNHGCSSAVKLEPRDIPQSPRLRVLCRTPQQVLAAATVEWLEEIVLDFLEVKGLKKSCEVVRAANKRVVVAMPRILKPQEKHLWEYYTTLDADALLVRGTGAIQQFYNMGGPGAVVERDGNPIGTIPALEGDFSLNASNALTASLLLDSGLESLALTFDCNSSQILGILERLGPRSGQVEIIIHSNLPIFHTEHCLFARFLSDGDDYTNCGRPCESKSLHIRDPSTGRDHLVEADMGCRNTIFEATSQTAVSYLSEFRSMGAGVFRVELVDQPPNVIPVLLEGYRSIITADKRNQREEAQHTLFEWMNSSLPDSNGRCHGVSAGSLEVKPEQSREHMKMTAAASRKRI